MNGEDLSYDDFLQFIEDLSTPWPYSGPVTRIFLDALAVAIGELDLLPWEDRTSTRLLYGLKNRMEYRIDQSMKAPSIQETRDLLGRLAVVSAIYRHERLLDLGQPLLECSLEPPCRFHP
jgi:hypothetical protein